MENKETLEIYNLTIKLLECLEKEYSIHKYNFDDISKKMFYKDSIEKVHDVRIRIEKKMMKDKKDVRKI
ncbi:hypothetical protein ACNSOS_00005 [Aliarcobacter vitoriensis]|uniref:Uncharacterized protein n=1 Tax=Aliarcobacter vitoriensis TaxID=2011099 RepID=A0A366MQY4_9BACT|nr:hypothetical protein [Aliarcobacter vitoriensis]RBQ28457.1 hypothetical protein CRU91_08840 [Aliarcobacter vitoriensis]RBQ32122.1 hypothetical protein CRU92_04955 [Arcobacter sp. FW59]